MSYNNYKKQAKRQAKEPPKEMSGGVTALVVSLKKEINEKIKQGDAHPISRDLLFLGFVENKADFPKDRTKITCSKHDMAIESVPLYSVKKYTKKPSDNIRVPVFEMAKHEDSYAQKYYAQFKDKFDKAPRSLSCVIHAGSIMKVDTGYGIDDTGTAHGVFAIEMSAYGTFGPKKKKSKDPTGDASTGNEEEEDVWAARIWLKYNGLTKIIHLDESNVWGCALALMKHTWSRRCYLLSQPVITAVGPMELPKYCNFFVPLACSKETLEGNQGNNYGIKDIVYSAYDPEEKKVHPNPYQRAKSLNFLAEELDKNQQSVTFLTLPLAWTVTSGVSSAPETADKLRYYMAGYTLSKATINRNNFFNMLGLANQSMITGFCRLMFSNSIDAWMAAYFNNVAPHSGDVGIDEDNEPVHCMSNIYASDVYFNTESLVANWGLRLGTKSEFEAALNVSKLDNMDEKLAITKLDPRRNEFAAWIEKKKRAFFSNGVLAKQIGMDDKADYYAILDPAWLGQLELLYFVKKDVLANNTEKLVGQALNDKVDSIISNPDTCPVFPVFTSLSDFEQRSEYLKSISQDHPPPISAAHLSPFTNYLRDGDFTCLILAKPKTKPYQVPDGFPPPRIEFPPSAREEDREQPLHPVVIRPENRKRKHSELEDDDPGLS